MATSAHAVRSPVESSMSSSRGSGLEDTWARELQEGVGRPPHRRDGADDPDAAFPCGDEPAGDVADLLGLAHGRSAEFHDDGLDLRFRCGAHRV